MVDVTIDENNFVYDMALLCVTGGGCQAINPINL
jgi:hypothetical protein